MAQELLAYGSRANEAKAWEASSEAFLHAKIYHLGCNVHTAQ